jgi:serine phosphatase RsbU (regulator of sigma subunit)
LRYERSGRVVHAGAHEEILVYRAASGEVEFIHTPGAWVGIVSELERQLEHHEFSLEPGDLMLLHTDGITEARNSEGEMFGLDRVAALLCEHREKPVDDICDAIMLQVREWMTRQDDDITLVLARHTAARRHVFETE